MYETHFLHEIAEQNYTKYNLKPFQDACRGIMLPVKSIEEIGLAIARYYSTINESFIFSSEPMISLPKLDQVSGGLYKKTS